MAFALLPIAAGAGAHEIGTTRISFTLHQTQTWSAEVITPPTPLLDRLEAAAGQPLSSAPDVDALRAGLDGFRRDIARKIEVKFDGIASPQLEVVQAINGRGIHPDHKKVQPAVDVKIGEGMSHAEPH